MYGSFDVMEPFRCSSCGEAVYDRRRVKAGEMKVVICGCGYLNLVGVPRGRKRGGPRGAAHALLTAWL